MKKVTLLMFLALIPVLVFAVSNAKINGQKEVTVTSLPADLVFTCDLAQAGNKLAVEYYVDFDMDGIVGPQDLLQEFLYVTDGIGWIRDPNDSDNDFTGDETGTDGKLHVTITMEDDNVLGVSGITGIWKLTDEDGSTDYVKVNLQIQPQPPFIQGKVTASNTGAPLQNIMVIADDMEGARLGITDANGDYKISVVAGTYEVAALEFPMVNYQPSDTVEVTVSGTTTQTQNFQLDPYECYVQGKLTLPNGTPVQGILVLATGDLTSSFYNYTVTDAQGNYHMGVMPGMVIVGPSQLMNMSNDYWPADHYVNPEADTLVVASGETQTSNFVFNPYTSFVTGRCTSDGVGLAGVQITGFALDMTTFTLRYYSAVSDADGNFRLGVFPGILNTLSANKEGYELTSPAGGYMNLNVLPNQTVTGKNFVFQSGSSSLISGNVTYGDGSAATNVYVAAENYSEESPNGFLISYTDGSGFFQFANVLEGEYHVGVFKSGYSSDPAQRFFYINSGMQETGQDFVLVPGTGVDSKDRILKPLTINLFQNYPNPFNPTTSIKFNLPTTSEVEIVVFNATGQKIRTLVNSGMSVGEHQVEWDGKDEMGNKVSSGFYFYQLKANNYNKVMKMILAK